MGPVPLIMPPSIRIAHLSDIHYTHGSVWEPESWAAGVAAVNREGADAVLMTGDFTDWGLRSEWEGIIPRLDEVHAPRITCLGNHDARREGWRIYEELMGRPRYYRETIGGVDFLVLDSSQPDLDDGQVGREQREWLSDRLAESAFPVVVLHHHLVPIPNTGREMNILRDAGGVLKVIDDHHVPLVVGGHRHMPWAWRVNETLIAHAGTFSSNKRQMPPSYNMITIEGDCVRVELVKFLTGERSLVAENEVPSRWGGTGKDRVEQVREAGLE